MASPQESVSMALFCDFENVALGVRDAKYEKFDITPVLERLLLKGSIVVKKAYCDWDRYTGFKASMHEASFELIEIPHVRQSGKNSADIRLVVDALDLCYTKSHVDTFVIISGDSDFSPLVSKLRENAKKVIGVGVKNSTSDLLVANCDEFIFYDDLVREQQRAAAKRESREAGMAAKRVADEDKHPRPEMESRKAQAIAIAVETFDALSSERGESGKIWASVLKSAIKRRKPDFSESYYGFRAFGNLLDEAQARGLLEVGRDDKSGAFVFRASSTAPEPARAPAAVAAAPAANENGALAEAGGNKGRKRGKSGGKSGRKPARDTVPNGATALGQASHAVAADEAAPGFEPELPIEAVAAEAPRNPSNEAMAETVAETATPKPRRARKSSTKTAGSAGSTPAKKSPRQAAPAASSTMEPVAASMPEPQAESKPEAAKAPRKSSARTARARKPSA
jgi:uncharacterized protein (TIGR00288 family)